MPPHPDAAAIAWSRAQHHAEALFRALDALEDAGGAGLAASQGRWSPSALDRAILGLEATREALDAELARLRARQRHFPRRRRIG